MVSGVEQRYRSSIGGQGSRFSTGVLVYRSSTGVKNIVKVKDYRSARVVQRYRSRNGEQLLQKNYRAAAVQE